MLLKYYFKIKYIKGINNIKADVFSQKVIKIKETIKNYAETSQRWEYQIQLPKTSNNIKI